MKYSYYSIYKLVNLIFFIFKAEIYHLNLNPENIFLYLNPETKISN